MGAVVWEKGECPLLCVRYQAEPQLKNACGLQAAEAGVERGSEGLRGREAEAAVAINPSHSGPLSPSGWSVRG